MRIQIYNPGEGRYLFEYVGKSVNSEADRQACIEGMALPRLSPAVDVWDEAEPEHQEGVVQIPLEDFNKILEVLWKIYS